MPRKAYLYAVPYEFYEKYAVRRYGFHGTSHRYLSERLAELMGKDKSEIKAITCHLGNGSSITAIDGGKCVDTSMGFTPLAGIPMGTRTGTIDPSVVTYLMEKENMTAAEMSVFMNKKCGFLGLSGISSDSRDIEDAAQAGDERAIRTQEVVRYEIVKYIGGYVAAMGGLDALVFSAGIGENNPTCAPTSAVSSRISASRSTKRRTTPSSTAKKRKSRRRARACAPLSSPPMRNT